MVNHHRRRFIKGVASLSILKQSERLLPALSRETNDTLGVDETASNLPVVDTHIHLYDPTRPGGIPWPEKSDTFFTNLLYPLGIARSLNLMELWELLRLNAAHLHPTTTGCCKLPKLMNSYWE